MKSSKIKKILIELLRYIYKKFLIFGFDLKILLNLRYYPRFIKNKKSWLKNNGAITHNYMILSDYHESAGNNKGHYFHQDLLVAQYIFQNKPRRHIDIGSRVDGFVAHVASFREIEVLDIRNLSNNYHPNIKFTKLDIMEEPNDMGLTDSLSCLHAIEHFGLGRYGDLIDVDGHLKGLKNMIKLIEPDGLLYLSFPIGEKDEIHFNAHRVFHPKSIFSLKGISENLELKRFDYIDDNGKIHIKQAIKNYPKNLNYGCGIYTFKVNKYN